MSRDLWRLEGEFVVTRRVPWDDDGAGLRSHIDCVVDSVRSGESAAEIEVDADLETAKVVLTVVVVVGEDGDGDSIARNQMASAIRDCGGRHEELLPLADESRLEVRAGPWAGLRTPMWRLFRMAGDQVVPD